MQDHWSPIACGMIEARPGDPIVIVARCAACRYLAWRIVIGMVNADGLDQVGLSKQHVDVIHQADSNATPFEKGAHFDG